MKLQSKAVFLEELRAVQLCRYVVHWMRGKRGPLGAGGGELFILYRVTRGAKVLIAFLRRWKVSLQVHELDYDFFDDVESPGGSPSLQETYFRAAPALVHRIERSGPYQEALRTGARKPSHAGYLHVFLSKRIYIQVSTRIRSVLVAEWFFREKLGGQGESAILYLQKDDLLQWLRDYSSPRCVELHPLAPPLAVEIALLRLKRFVHRGGEAWRIFRDRLRFSRGVKQDVRIAVEMYFNGIGLGTVYNTDLFWWKESDFPRDSVFAYFTHPGDQPTPERRERLRSVGIGHLDRNQVRCLMQGSKEVLPGGSIGRSTTRTHRIFTQAIDEFYEEYARWFHFFVATRARIHVSSSDHFPQSEALHAALEDTGGISVSLQRSIEFDPRIYRRTVVDVHFGFGRDSAGSERLSGSTVRQFITAGYPFDGVFPAAREYGRQLREQLQLKGVRFIIGFVDENKGFTPRYFGGRKQFRVDYGFLCDRLSEDRTMGLILKPKRPQSLAQILGPVWARLEKFLQEGRCICLAGGTLDERYLPCVAAAAADLVISYLDGGTAGLEAALLGKRVFLISRKDRPGLFGELPPGSVLFEDWKNLWQAVEELRLRPDHPTLGNWEPILDRLACPRDGQTAERISSYLKELWKVLEQGKSQKEALEQAGRVYAVRWGPHWSQEIQQPLFEKPGDSEKKVQFPPADRSPEYAHESG